MSSSPNCDPELCTSISQIGDWWTCIQNEGEEWKLVVALVLIFLASFLPMIMVRLIVLVIKKIKALKDVAEDFQRLALWSTTGLLSATLVWLGLLASGLLPYFCNFPLWIWGVFFIIWLNAIFNVSERAMIRKMANNGQDYTKKVIISESIGALKFLVILIVAAIIYLKVFQGYEDQLLIAVIGMVAFGMALGSMATVHNAFGGLVLVLNEPFKVGHFIEIGDVKGVVQRVFLRYTELQVIDSSIVFVPNSIFLYKPLVNYTVRPKRKLEIIIPFSKDTQVSKQREFLKEAELVLQNLHFNLTSHVNNTTDVREGEQDPHYFFVCMDDLFKARVFTYSDEIDPKKHAMIKSEVWLAMMELMEDLGIEMDEEEDFKQHAQPVLTEDEPTQKVDFGREFRFVLDNW